MYSVCNYAMPKVVGYYDLSVLPMSVVAFKKVWMGCVGGVSSTQVLFGFLDFLTLQ